MGHNVAGFVARWQPKDRSMPGGDNGVIAPLNRGYGLLVLDETAGVVPDELDEAIAETGRELSVEHGAVAYVVTDYFGGIGHQGAAAWHRGLMAMAYETSKLGSINAALRAIGVERNAGTASITQIVVASLGPRQDLFDAIGLGRHCHNEDWIEAAKASAA